MFITVITLRYSWYTYIQTKDDMLNKTKPRFKLGDKVQLHGRQEWLTIKGAKHNGFAWMYSFKETDEQCNIYSIETRPK
jgi:hypothetical protein